MSIPNKRPVEWNECCLLTAQLITQVIHRLSCIYEYSASPTVLAGYVPLVTTFENLQQEDIYENYQVHENIDFCH